MVLQTLIMGWINALFSGFVIYTWFQPGKEAMKQLGRAWDEATVPAYATVQVYAPSQEWAPVISTHGGYRA
jgi:hypothetical protein